ncbi:Acyl-CoA dehydrogenase [archaeon HR01]|nr:Acyl-CoA dehydrogenase [archaeon HR01]
MDFNPSDEERVFRDQVSAFCSRKIAPRWVDIDERGEIEPQLIKDMADAGLLGVTLPEEYGGQGGTFTEAAIAGEEIAYSGPALSIAVLYLIQASWPYIVHRYGGEELRYEILPRIAAGEAVIGISSTEAHGGSDISSILCRADRLEDGSWVINGEKSMTSLPSVVEKMPWGGGWFLIARTGDPALKHRTITDFLVLMKRDGRLVEGISYKPWTEFARRGLDTSVIRFDNVRVEPKYVVGGVNSGFKIAMEGFNLARSMIGAVCVGCARWLMDQAVEWLRRRKVFGKPLASYQGISFKLADYAKELEAARLLSYKAAWMADRYYLRREDGVSLSDVALWGAMAKLKCAGLAVDLGEDVMKWFGGASYFKETPIFRAWLAAFSYVVGAEGAENIMRLIIAREILGREYVE